MPTIQPDDLLPPAALASRLGVKTTTVLGWHREGRIPARRLSHKILRFRLADVLAALERHQSTRQAQGREVGHDA